MHCSKTRLYSITSSAVANSVGGTERPSDLAVWWLMTSSSHVDGAMGYSNPGVGVGTNKVQGSVIDSRCGNVLDEVTHHWCYPHFSPQGECHQ
jgi:hypothetical protein